MTGRRRAWITKDVLLMLGGIIGAAHEEWTGRFNPYALLLYGLAAGIPGLLNALIVLRQTGPGYPTSTPESSAPEVSRPSP